MESMYLTESPWIIITYPMSDEEADANGGRSLVVLDCCICGVEQELPFTLPPEGDPIWVTVDPKRGLPETEQIRNRFQLEHLHEDRQGDPMLTWAKPLRNPAALTGGIDLRKLTERLLNDLNRQTGGE